jgi:hypothetical protein
MTTAQHAQVPAQARLADPQAVGQVLYRDLAGPGQELQDAQSGKAGQALKVGSKLA